MLDEVRIDAFGTIYAFVLLDNGLLDIGEDGIIECDVIHEDLLGIKYLAGVQSFGSVGVIKYVVSGILLMSTCLNSLIP
jgi:hypothetical protein